MASYTNDGDFVEQVRLFNVANYLHGQDVVIDVPGLGALKINLSYGGNYYAIVEPQKAWSGLDGMSARDIVRLSPLVRQAAQEALRPVHPEDERINGVSHVMWCDKPKHPRAHARNAVFYGEKAIDRSPCGIGSSARMAQPVAKGRLGEGTPSYTRASSERSSTAVLSRSRPLVITRRSSQVLPAGQKSLGTTRSSSTIAIRSLTVFR
ncbi:4-hydroxyproline epimerase [Pseudomonas coronafaciens pv. oryzae]|nr:proline racemase family protein [Pseudomonas coronafaciens]KPZ23580.1 4-hydroxyproline epimerase [Pseudomonas coronafaciens pv. zizaniae]RMS92962.1 4-hydroxyproline epimerase [Pseudomonas coronafaciens pv. oryzae]RMS96134.1 4-hydroxyproline epimerase [Pseudomonas coronafaciens pv. oryzae]